MIWAISFLCQLHNICEGLPCLTLPSSVFLSPPLLLSDVLHIGSMVFGVYAKLLGNSNYCLLNCNRWSVRFTSISFWFLADFRRLYTVRYTTNSLVKHRIWKNIDMYLFSHGWRCFQINILIHVASVWHTLCATGNIIKCLRTEQLIETVKFISQVDLENMI